MKYMKQKQDYPPTNYSEGFKTKHWNTEHFFRISNGLVLE